MLPEWMQNIASLFPLKWMAQGMRSVFLPEGFEVLEQNGDVEPRPGRDRARHLARRRARLSRLTFRWIRRDA